MRSWFVLISILVSVSAAFAQPPAVAALTPAQIDALRKALHATPAHVVEAPSDALKAEALKPEAAKPAPAKPVFVTPEAIKPGVVKPEALKPPTPVVVAPVLRPGVLYQLHLSRDEERQIDKAVTEQVKADSPGTRVVPLPGVVRLAAKDGSEVHLKPFALPGQPLTYQPGSALFEGSIRVGVADIVDRTEGKALSAPMTFQVREGQMAQPDSVELDATSPPHKTIMVRSKSPGQSVTVHVVSRFDPDGTAVTLPVDPTLIVRLERAEIQGYGLETTMVHIASYGLAKPAGRVVQLGSSPSAFFDHGEATLSENGTAAVSLRSDAPGPVTITASAPGLASGSATVVFLWPAQTLMFGLVGGLIGGLLRYLTRGRRIAARGFVVGLVVAVLTGLLVFFLYAVGVNVLPFEPKVTVGAVLVLVVSALGAWFGTGLLAKLGRA